MSTIIIGEQVVLRQQKAEDAAFFAHWYNDRDIMFKCGFTKETTIEQEIERIERRRSLGDEVWFTVTTNDGKIVGETGLLRMWPAWHCTDLSIILPDPATHGKGYGKETINLMIDLAFSHFDMNRISIGVVGQNHAALRFYKYVGFKVEGKQESPAPQSLYQSES